MELLWELKEREEEEEGAEGGMVVYKLALYNYIER